MLEALHEKIQRWLWLQGWKELYPIQKNAIAPILAADTDVIVSAPTAAGKTEAVFLPILSALAEKPADHGFSVLYISPLKALINDQGERLKQLAGAIGMDVTPWHGDIASSKKQNSLLSPSLILLITPESLEALFVNKPHLLEEAVASLRYIVVDELHAFVGSERGKQLQSLMARIEHMMGRKVPRIAMSATFAHPQLAREALRPGASYPCAFPDAGSGGHETRLLIKEYVSAPERDVQTEIKEDIFHRLRGTNNLVFANSRKEAETLALQLSDESLKENVPNEFFVHHGSLSKQEREGIEHRLHKGQFPTTAVCTSTLELGIDVGKVKSVAQLGVVNSVSGLRQRLGRSGRRGEPSVLRIYSVDEQRNDYKFHLRTNLVQNIAAVELMRQGLYESPSAKNPHFSTLVQQVLSVVAQYGSFYPRDAYALLCTNGAFRNVSPNEFLALLSYLGGKEVLAMTPSGLVVIGKAGERILHQRDFYTSFVTLKDWNVIDKQDGKIIGSIQYKPYIGEHFLLAGRRWIVESIRDKDMNVYVNATQTTGKLMFEGFGAEVDGMLTRKMQEIYLGNAPCPYLDKSLGSQHELEQARAYFRETGLHRTNFVEIGGTSLYFSWQGMRANRYLALLLSEGRDTVPEFDPFAISDVSEEEVRRVLKNPPDIQYLVAAKIQRNKKMKCKYDYLLPDSLLDREYAASYLEMPSA